MYRVILEVKNVKGECAAKYKVGDRIIVEEPYIISSESSNICIYALNALTPYLTVLYRDTSKSDWINYIEELQCPDPINTVTFRVIRLKI